MPKKISQELQSFLDGLEKEKSPNIWGFTVYSTYPTSVSEASEEEEALDKRVCERFQAYIESNLRFAVEEPYGVKIPLDIEYIRLPSASIAEAREHFRAKCGLPEKRETGIVTNLVHYGMRYGVFVVIDEETMKTLLDAPVDLSPAPGEKEGDVVIKVVDVTYDEACEGIVFATRARGPLPKDSPHNITFYGYMKTTPRWLMEVWTTLMLFDFKFIFRGKDKVYKGDW